MKISINNRSKTDEGLLIVPIFSDDLQKAAHDQPEAVQKFAAERIKNKEFNGKAKESSHTYLQAKQLPAQLLIFGLGEKAQLTATLSRELGAKMAKLAKAAKVEELSVALPIELEAYCRELTEGLLMALYEFNYYKTKKEEDQKSLKSLEFITGSKSKAFPEMIKNAETVVEAFNYTRDLVNKPSNEVDMEYLAKEAKTIAHKNGYKIVVLGQKELVKLGWGGLLSVNKGSGKEAKCIVLEHDGGSRNERPISIIGKGIVFDTGGYNLKPSKSIETMHQDMAGAAAVLGLFKILKKLKVKKNVVGIIPTAANLINENAYRPSDIIKMFSGLTVEITNTDAEGRLILADAISYATRLKPESIITIATLTGAVSVALGHRFAGLMTNNPMLMQNLKMAGEEVDDMGWHLPIHDDVRKKLDSEVADCKNCDISSNRAGSQSGAAFLEKFVENYPWCHIDIGGTAYTNEPREFETNGATAWGMRMMLKFLQNS